VGHTIEISFLELLASKICHDLISPIGAIANGIEFMEDMGAGDDEVLDLLKFSSTQASAKLQAFRMAYGAGGGDVSVKPEEAHKAFGKFIELDKKITQDWDPHSQLGPEDRPDGLTKMIMCLLLLCAECLPKGGNISLKSDGEDKIIFTASGDDAALKPPRDRALLGNMKVDAIEPRYTHAFMTSLMARAYNYTLSFENNSGNAVKFTLNLPA